MRPDPGTLRDPASMRCDATQIPTRSSKSSFYLICGTWAVLILALLGESRPARSTGLILGAGGGDVRRTDSTVSSD